MDDELTELTPEQRKAAPTWANVSIKNGLVSFVFSKCSCGARNHKSRISSTIADRSEAVHAAFIKTLKKVTQLLILLLSFHFKSYVGKGS
jgi:hypothetical protein